MKSIIVEYLDQNNEVVRVGLYQCTGTQMRWIKWLSKKDYKLFARINEIEIITARDENI